MTLRFFGKIMMNIIGVCYFDDNSHSSNLSVRVVGAEWTSGAENGIFS